MDSHNDAFFTKDGNIVEQIRQDLLKRIEERDISQDRAYLELCVDYLGFNLSEGLIADGKDDCGIDFLEYSASGATIIQAKCLDFTSSFNVDALAGPDRITDVPRIRSIFANLDALPPNMKASLKRNLNDMKSEIVASSVKGVAPATPPASLQDPYHVTVYFCFLGFGFTDAAQSEFNKLDITPIQHGSKTITLSYMPVFLDDLVREKWRESNTKWITKGNIKKEKFDFPVSGAAIRDQKSIVFFTKAEALAGAYRDIGYQLFEANVRCEIKNSPVNKQIRKSILSHKGRNEFKHLNNGATIVCENFEVVGPKDRPTAFRITKPGVINGLQTIKTISDSIGELSVADRQHFSDKCEVLIRLHTQNAVGDYRDLVKSTNNQNPMKPRNLRSNDAEQIKYEVLFSNLGWFYERKEGAWNAFSSDHKRWSTLHNRNPTDFKSGKLIRRVDNEEIAQNWLAFIGFAEQAVDQKRYLFQNDRIYDLVFKHRTKRHGAAYNFKLSNDLIFEESNSAPPDPNGLLVAHLLREFAGAAVKSRRDNRDEAVKRLGLEKREKSEQENELAKDNDYLCGIVIRGMLVLFVDFVGFLMFQAFDDGVHAKIKSFASNASMGTMAKSGDLNIALDRQKSGDFDANDLLITLWEFYSHCVTQLVASTWGQQWQQAPNRSKFVYSDLTRKALIKEIEVADKLFKKKLLTRVWTHQINNCGGISAYLQHALPG